MIDIHSHVLWALDDGSESLEQTLAMLAIAVEHGTTDIVATPHANFRYPYRHELVKQRLAEVAAASGGRPVVHRGCDFHLTFDNIQDALELPGRYAINGGPYLLVEFPDHSVAGMDQPLSALLGRGLVPIMTHPERHPQLREIIPPFLDWIQLGCLVQVTAQSLLGRFGRRSEESAWEMIERGLAHFVASDAHDDRDRTPRLDEAYDAVSKRVSRAAAERLFVENPRAVISGAKVVGAAPRRKRWFQFGR